MTRNIDEAVAQLLEILRDAGRERERAALELAAELAKKLTPFSLIAVAIVAELLHRRKSNDRQDRMRETERAFREQVQLPQNQDALTKSLPRLMAKKLAANARLGAVCRTTDLLRLGMGFFDRLQYRLRVSRLSHSLCFLIDAITNERIIPTGIFV